MWAKTGFLPHRSMKALATWPVVEFAQTEMSFGMERRGGVLPSNQDPMVWNHWIFQGHSGDGIFQSGGTNLKSAGSGKGGFEAIAFGTQTIFLLLVSNSLNMQSITAQLFYT